MATIAKQNITEAGVDLTLSTAAGGGDQFTNTGKELLVILNGDASSKTVTVTAQQTSATVSSLGLMAKEDQSVVVAAGGIGVIGPFPTQSFNDANNYAQVTYSAVTSVEVAVISS